jgi:hypothetical protein
MKKLGFALAAAFLAAAAAHAQNWGGFPQEVSVSGALQLHNGVIAVASGSGVYFAPELARYVGFIEGLKEGAHVNMRGFASGNHIRPTQAIIDGKAYDFKQNAPQSFAHNRGYYRSGRGGGWEHHRGGHGRRRGW